MEIPNIQLGLVDRMIRLDVIKFGGPFTLKDGRESDFYFNIRDTISDPEMFEGTVHALGNLTTAVYFDDDIVSSLLVDRYMMGIPEAMSEYAGAVGYSQSIPLLKRRVKQKNYGVPRPIEGSYRDGDQVVLLDDVAVSAKSKKDEAALLKQHKLVTAGVAVVIDRQMGGRTELENSDIPFAAVFTTAAICKFALEKELISSSMFDRVMSELKPEEL